MAMHFALRLLALSAAVALGAATPPDPLARIAAATGHPGAVHVRAVSDRTVEGRRVVVTYEQAGTRRLIRRCVAEACSGTWFDGRRLWSFGINDVPLPENDDPFLPVRRTLAAIVSYAFVEPSFRDAGGSVAPAGPGAWRVRSPDGAALTAQLDPASFAIRRVVDGTGQVVATYDRFVRVGGATFALTHAGLDELAVDAAEAIPGPLLAPGGAMPIFGADQPLALDNDPVPIVRCTLAGRPARCLLDTGATPSAITLPFAETLQLEPRGELEIAGFSRFVTGFVDSGPLTLGPARFPAARFAVLPPVAAARFDVVVGADLLGRLRVTIDRRRAIVDVHAPRDAAPNGALPLRLHNGVPSLEVRLNGAPTTALLDTGDASIVSLGYAAYRQGPQWPVTSRAHASGVAGGSDAFVVAIPDVRLGSLSFGVTPATVNRTQQRAHVGIGIWAYCALELDEANEALTCPGPAGG